MLPPATRMGTDMADAVALARITPAQRMVAVAPRLPNAGSPHAKGRHHRPLSAGQGGGHPLSSLPNTCSGADRTDGADAAGDQRTLAGVLEDSRPSWNRSALPFPAGSSRTCMIWAITSRPMPPRACAVWLGFGQGRPVGQADRPARRTAAAGAARGKHRNRPPSCCQTPRLEIGGNCWAKLPGDRARRVAYAVSKPAMSILKPCAASACRSQASWINCHQGV